MGFICFRFASTMERFSGVFNPFTLMETRQMSSVLPVGMAAAGRGIIKKIKNEGKGVGEEEE